MFSSNRLRGCAEFLSGDAVVPQSTVGFTAARAAFAGQQQCNAAAVLCAAT
jgi:hypothetical protein